MRFLVFFCLLLSVPLPVWADDAVPLLYSRSHITVTRHAPPAPAPAKGALPWQEAPKADPNLVLDVEVRDATVLYRQEGWFNLNSLSDHGGVLMAFAAPRISPVIRSEQYAPLDILMIDKEGRIVQIAPNIVLAELREELLPPSPILAFLFLNGGACERLSIKPGDTVEYAIFKKPPTLLNAPAVSDAIKN